MKLLQKTNNKFMCEMNCKKNNLFEEINRKLYIKV